LDRGLTSSIAAKVKALRRGVKEVVKTLRKLPPNPTPENHPGIVVIAADISPMDVISHIPVLCEEHSVPYIFVTSRAELGAAGSTKRPTSVVLVGKKQKPVKGDEADEEYKEAYESLEKYVNKESLNIRY
jgi:H/ACA ribonucleoprotein complex subunit 2